MQKIKLNLNRCESVDYSDNWRIKMKDLKAIILAAGKGTRMKSDTTPKVLHQIMGKTLLGYVLDNVKNITSSQFVIVGHHAEEVEKFVENNYTKAQTILQKPQLGTGHAVSMVCPELEDYKGMVLILCGDTPIITEQTLNEFVVYHEVQEADLTVMSTIMDNPTNYGRIVRDKNNSLECIVEEKDATDEQKEIKEVNAGIYCFDWKTFKAAFKDLKNNNAQGEYYLTDIIKWGKARKLKMEAFVLENSDEVFGINSRKDLAKASKIINQRNLDRYMENGVTIVDTESTWISVDTEIGPDTIIYPSTYIEGKNKIGMNCKIGPCAHLRGDVEIWDNIKIGNFVEIKKSKISSDTNVGHLSYIGDSELGQRVNIGAGTITANYNAITKKKSQTIIKNDVKIGSNSVLVAPVTIDDGANVGAGGVITKDVPAWSLAITRSPLKILANWVGKIKKNS